MYSTRCKRERKVQDLVERGRRRMPMDGCQWMQARRERSEGRKGETEKGGDANKLWARDTLP